MPVAGPYNLRKRNRDQDQEAKTNDKIAKRIKAILALLEQGEFDLDNQETVFAISKKIKEIIQIPIPKLYSTAVANPIYRLE